ncbi:MAG TPA: hypothetical protein VFM88_10150 [Vicinamibacteria bacterium]|nr:hypothetical protein [Vicinamibacteria bacterium]
MLSEVLVDVQRRLEALYALDPEPPVTDFLVDQAAALSPGSRTLVAQEGDEVRLGVVLDGEVRDEVARADPRVRLDAGNLAALCTLTEEVSHFLYVLFCARCRRSVTQLELELQGEVDKYLTAVSLLSVQNEGAVSRRLRDLLFRSYRLREGLAGESAERYREASRLAWTYCGYLESAFLRRARLVELRREARRFYRLGQQDKLLKIAAL